MVRGSSFKKRNFHYFSWHFQVSIAHICIIVIATQLELSNPIVFSFLKGTNGEDKDYGYEFVFGIPEVRALDNPHVMISTAAKDPIHATVTIPGSEFKVNKTLVRGVYVDVTLPGSVYLRGTGVQSNKTVVVRASVKVSVHVMANEGKSFGDGFLVLPTKQLGTDHYVLSYTPSASNSGIQFGSYAFSFICVSAIKGNTSTNVKIKTKSNQIINVELLPYESFQFKSVAAYEDFSGSRITSSKPVTVIAGSECSFVGFSYRCKALIEQMPQTKIWGTRVVLSPFAEIDHGYAYRVLGTNVTTKATISNVDTRTLIEGTWYQGYDIDNKTKVIIESDNPILVMQFILSGNYDTRIGNPSMIIVPTTNLYMNSKTVFPVFNTNTSTHAYHIHVITDCSKAQGLTYDNHFPMANWERLTSADGEMCSVRGNVSAGAVHTISHEDENANFTVAVYGLDSGPASASYAYIAALRSSGKNCGFNRPYVIIKWNSVLFSPVVMFKHFHIASICFFTI